MLRHMYLFRRQHKSSQAAGCQCPTFQLATILLRLPWVFVDEIDSETDATLR